MEKDEEIGRMDHHLSDLLLDLVRACIIEVLIIYSVLIIMCAVRCVLFEGSTVLFKLRSMIPTRRQSQIKRE